MVTKLPELVSDLVTNQLIISLVSCTVTTIGGLVSGLFIGRYRKHKKHEEELKKIKDEQNAAEEKRKRAWEAMLKANTRALIFKAYQDYVIDKKHLTIDRFREITEAYEAYEYCGGNGTAKKYYKTIAKLNPYLVVD